MLALHYYKEYEHVYGARSVYAFSTFSTFLWNLYLTIAHAWFSWKWNSRSLGALLMLVKQFYDLSALVSVR